MGTNAIFNVLHAIRNKAAVYNITLSHLVRWQLLRRFLHDYPAVAGELFFPPIGTAASSKLNDSSTLYRICAPPTEVANMILSGPLQGNFKTRRLQRVYHGGSTTKLVTNAITSWPQLGTQGGHDDGASVIKSMAVFWIAALIYGALHAVA